MRGARYRKNPLKQDKFRAIHHALVWAVGNGRKITLTIVLNCTREELSVREQLLKAQLRAEGVMLLNDLPSGGWVPPAPLRFKVASK